MNNPQRPKLVLLLNNTPWYSWSILYFWDDAPINLSEIFHLKGKKAYFPRMYILLIFLLPTYDLIIVQYNIMIEQQAINKNLDLAKSGFGVHILFNLSIFPYHTSWNDIKCLCVWSIFLLPSHQCCYSYDFH